MTDLFDQVEDGVEDITPFLNEHFNVRGPDRVPARDINIVDRAGIDKKISSDDNALGAYVSDNGENYIIVFSENIADSDYDMSKPVLGEEVSHIIYQNTTQTMSNYLGTSDEPSLVELQNVSFENWVRANTVAEFVGRLGAINTSVEFGGSLEEDDYMEELRNNAVEEDADANIDTSVVLDQYLRKNLAEVRMDPDVHGIMDSVTHSAGYRAAEENIMDANNDTELIYKGTDRLWSEYNLKNNVRDRLDMIMNPEQ